MTNNMVAIAEKFKKLAVTAAANGGFWIAVNGNTLTIAARIISARSGFDFHQTLNALEDAMAAYSKYWARDLRTLQNQKDVYMVEKFRWSISTIAKAAHRFA